MNGINTTGVVNTIKKEESEKIENIIINLIYFVMLYAKI